MTPTDAHAAALSVAFVAQHEDCAPLDEAIAAYLASLRASGYVVVPVEPTEEMIDAVDYHSEIATAIRDAISAAPKFPPEADHG